MDDEEYLLLSETNIKDNFTFSYWLYSKCLLDNWKDDENWTDFRFRKAGLKNALKLDKPVKTENRLKVDPFLEALCLLLRRLALPCRYSELIPRFGRSVPSMSNFQQLWI